MKQAREESILSRMTGTIVTQEQIPNSPMEGEGAVEDM